MPTYNCIIIINDIGSLTGLKRANIPNRTDRTVLVLASVLLCSPPRPLLFLFSSIRRPFLPPLVSISSASLLPARLRVSNHARAFLSFSNDENSQRRRLSFLIDGLLVPRVGRFLQDLFGDETLHRRFARPIGAAVERAVA